MSFPRRRRQGAAQLFSTNLYTIGDENGEKLNKPALEFRCCVDSPDTYTLNTIDVYYLIVHHHNLHTRVESRLRAFVF